MMNKTIFELKNISVEFEKHSLNQRSLREAIGSRLKGRGMEKTKALNNISLTIKEGEHIGIIGRNGAGKSTLLKVLTKVIFPTNGKIIRDKTEFIIPLLELGIGFQPDLSGRENCYLAGILMGYSKKEISDKMNDIIAFSELEEFIDEPVKNYSSGMYARLAFAIATDINPQVLIVDEVFGVGDEFFMRKCIIRMQKLMAEGVTTIFVAHNIDFLVAQCERLIWLEKGEVLLDGNPADVASAYRNLKSPLRLVNVQ
jgi:ABC-type polysaccharide/polyol phosphate transport system ATPase subunit